MRSSPLTCQWHLQRALTSYDAVMNGSNIRVSTISKLSDEVLLEIFNFCRKNHNPLLLVWPWHVLAHVCQRWREIVFASPHRLNLRIFCRNGSPVRENLCIWPAFPIVIKYRYSDFEFRTRWPWRSQTRNDEDNIIAALEHPDRVCSVELNGTGSQLEQVSTVMQVPFPVLTHLRLIHHLRDFQNAAVLPPKFLGGSAPCLQEITFVGIPFPSLPTLLLSASDLVKLRLENIPPTSYIAPDVMAACLVSSPRLEWFIIGFQFANPRPHRLYAPPLSRAILPSLTSFVFKGTSEYLEELVSRIEGPQLSRIFTDYLNQLVDFQVAQFSKFIDRSVCPEFTIFKHAHVVFSCDWVYFTTSRHASHLRRDEDRDSAGACVSCQGIDWQVSHMAQLLSQFSLTLSNIVHLRLWFQGMVGLEGMNDVEWLNFLLKFSAVQTLHVCKRLAGHVALALEDIPSGMFTEVLPSLQSIYLEGHPAISLIKFAITRRLSGRSVTVNAVTRTVFDDKSTEY